MSSIYSPQTNETSSFIGRYKRNETSSFIGRYCVSILIYISYFYDHPILCIAYSGHETENNYLCIFFNCVFSSK